MSAALVLCAAAFSSSARATVVVTPVNAGGYTSVGVNLSPVPGAPVSQVAGFTGSTAQTAFFAVVAPNNLLGANSFIDPGVTAFDLTQTQFTDSSRGQMVLFDVFSDKQFSVAAGQALVVTVHANFPQGSTVTNEFVPITAMGPTANGGIPGDCDGVACTGPLVVDNGIQLYGAAVYTQQTSLRIGIYLKELCVELWRLHGTVPVGCDPTNVEPMPTNTSIDMPLTFAFSVVNFGALPAISDTAESASVTLHLQAQPPTYQCGDLTHLYFPGDGSIRLDPAGMAAAMAPTDAGAVQAILVARDGGLPDVSSSYSTSGKNSIVDRLAYNGTQDAGGFINTTNGSDHSYDVTFLERDNAGFVVAPPSFTGCTNTSASCCISGVQTSAIEGFLTKSSCFIATAAFESGDAPPVVMLRAFRDRILLHHLLGRAFVHWYYAWSPPAAEWLLHHPLVRYPVLFALIPLEVVAALALLIQLFPLVTGAMLAAALAALAVYLFRRAEEDARGA